MTFELGPALLFCPADRPERFDKAAERADAVIIDLEDAVSPANREEARAALVQHPLDPERTIVRVNPVGSAECARDLVALAATDYRFVMAAKAESAAQMTELAAYEVIALCETAAGVQGAALLAAAPNVVALMWGAEDLIASLGGTSSRDVAGRYREVARHARNTVLIAAGAAGVAAIDSVYLDIPDTDGLGLEAADAVASGFRATACIHPSQVSVIRAAYEPTADAVAHAHALLAAAATERGVFQFGGRMIDEPVLRHAQAVLTRWAASRDSS
ncbi:CoA ester lyase [Cryobacterium sp. CG_9.6]|uniref:HpcH/HpaI aldolase/citrate lyase family protein n=1 Tax=Cryobacterium sp. CG_9.6 TaxID=2760710 RepID=UPI0024766113|nr:CoA ester lyase [Cryobacterium sp. CG_9.6]MDH6236590.1 citrate lyase subunit beta/citryl-CoA lyase [Cryobacterium sp. CG_9.6]